MADEPDNIVLIMLRKIDQRTERMAQDLQDLKARVQPLKRDWPARTGDGIVWNLETQRIEDKLRQ